VWLTYDVSDVARRVISSASNASISIGYAGTFGGARKLDGGSDGVRTVENQLRLTYMMFLAPTWQCLLSVNHDLGASGQFKQDFGLVLRIGKLF
jgi:hypothetical protein